VNKKHEPFLNMDVLIRLRKFVMIKWYFSRRVEMYQNRTPLFCKRTLKRYFPKQIAWLSVI